MDSATAIAVTLVGHVCPSSEPAVRELDATAHPPPWRAAQARLRGRGGSLVLGSAVSMVSIGPQAPDIAAMDLFVVPTIGFDLLYVLVIVRLARRDLVWINVTTNPTAEWIACQITEAFPWAEAPRYLIRDRDQVYGTLVTRRLRAMGIRDKPIAPGSPWQNGFAERLIGSIRREGVAHVVAVGEGNLRRVLRSYARYYNEMRTHRSLDKDAPLSRPVQRTGSIKSHALLGGVHHHYIRV